PSVRRSPGRGRNSVGPYGDLKESLRSVDAEHTSSALPDFLADSVDDRAESTAADRKDRIFDH
ncbi:hypothetical protein PJN93_32705, partial [Mycobacterium kansasii]